ncbi:P-loop containing nucleoside triphosphate hydrolase protein [Xylaria sp. CBS 124048]|nr:P-loop containing nucleoside triphosphate hydrolase protein [Xylaria sp. CBS 124048]
MPSQFMIGDTRGGSTIPTGRSDTGPFWASRSGRGMTGRRGRGRLTDRRRHTGSSTMMGDDQKEDGADSGPKVQANGDGTPQTDTSDAHDDKTMKCEIKHLDRCFDDHDEQYFEERKEEVTKPEQKDWWRLYAFCIVRLFNEFEEPEWTRLYVNPQPLRQLLKDIIGNYPSDPINVKDVQIASPYYSLFYCREELATVGRERFKDDEESTSHLNLLLNWIENHFKLDIEAYQNCISGDVKAISYKYLWTLFAPKTIIHGKVLDQHRAFRVHSSWYETGDSPSLNVVVIYIDYDGERLGERRSDIFIPKYVGIRDLSDLEARPLALHEDSAGIREYLLARGRKFESYIGQHFKRYDGIAVKRAETGYIRINVEGRVVIDCRTYHRLEANDSFCVKDRVNEALKRKSAAKMRFASDKQVHERLSDEDACLTNATVRGFSFTAKKFLEFFVDNVSPIQWDTACFDALVLDAHTKKTIQALVSTHSKERDSMDDIVNGKGRGLVCVLHGPPGVGKTLTAECVAEYVQRPLFMVSSGDLGTTSTSLDESLSRVMDMTAIWKAVLLIDEADIFLERRSLYDLHRNAMVSVFLRVLEYYSGILFLTTNRVNTFDDAFRSRIHIPIRYTDLSPSSRMQIWRNFCDRVPGGVDIDEAGFRTLAEHELNGRQIKNVIKAAESLAEFDGTRLSLKTLEDVTKIQARFEQDLTSVAGIDYTAPGSARKYGESKNMFL